MDSSTPGNQFGPTKHPNNNRRQHRRDYSNIDAEAISSTSYGQFTVKEIRQPASTPLRVKRKRSLLDSTLAGKKLTVLSEEKRDLLQLQRQAVEEQIEHQRMEHDTKRRHMKEENASKMKLLELKIRNRELDLETKNKMLQLDTQNRELDLKLKNKQLP
ncbi:hypothetical protein C0J52_13577 [Blattella germanica]|nr:hypothetical protein C0J52_13577 [Blattella germanica]